VSDKQILFKPRMVNAIRDGIKTQTRRVFTKGRCPYGPAGRMLWVRETWRPVEGWDDASPSKIPAGEPLEYLSDKLRDPDYNPLYDYGTWRPSIFMPRWASRLRLRVTDDRVERLDDISDDDCLAEGIEALADTCLFGKTDGPTSLEFIRAHPRLCFLKLWNDINEKRGYGLSADPTVWVVRFEVMK